MRTVDRTIKDAIMVAKLYYYHGLTTEAIARELRFSRPKVSRLLSVARERGVVEIKIHDDDQYLAPVSNKIRDTFGLREVHVVAAPEILGEVVWLARVAQYTANYINSVLQNGQILGLAWGTTLSSVSEHLIPKHIRDLSIVQLNGSGNTFMYDNSYASSILQKFGDNYSARVYQLPVPTFFDYAETKKQVWRERSVLNIVQLQQRANVLLYSIGAVNAGVPSQVYQGGYLEAEDLKELKREKVVADIATVFYRSDGSYKDMSINTRASGPPLDFFKRAERAICVVSGSAKAPGLLAALRAGYLNELIVDEPTAHLLSRLMDRSAK